MKIKIIAILLAVCITLPLLAQQQDTTQTVQKQPPPPKKKSSPGKVYYGGTLGLSFGNYFRISIAPLIGYAYSPKTSVGVRVGYEYVQDKRYDETLTAHNYGASVFGRYRPIPKVYGHAEFVYFSYKYKISELETERDWVPFFLLGAGFVQPISPAASAFVEVLVDVLNDPKSPYKEWDPQIRVGVAAGF
jgi:hypothetical protein